MDENSTTIMTWIRARHDLSERKTFEYVISGNICIDELTFVGVVKCEIHYSTSIGLYTPVYGYILKFKMECEHVLLTLFIANTNEMIKFLKFCNLLNIDFVFIKSMTLETFQQVSECFQQEQAQKAIGELTLHYKIDDIKLRLDMQSLSNIKIEEQNFEFCAFSGEYLMRPQLHYGDYVIPTFIDPEDSRKVILLDQDIFTSIFLPCDHVAKYYFLCLEWTKNKVKSFDKFNDVMPVLEKCYCVKPVHSQKCRAYCSNRKCALKHRIWPDSSHFSKEFQIYFDFLKEFNFKVPGILYFYLLEK